MHRQVRAQSGPHALQGLQLVQAGWTGADMTPKQKPANWAELAVDIGLEQ
jgi:hypothetical protein